MNTPNLEARFASVTRNITAVTTNQVRIIAISKNRTISEILHLHQLGQRDFGENYAQELSEKAQKIEAAGISDIRWHFVGHLQTNKIKLICPYLFAVHSVDSERLAVGLATQWKRLGRIQKLNVYIEVNVDLEPQKSGIAPQEVSDLSKAISSHPELALVGLMCIPQPINSKLSFQKLKDLELTLAQFSQRRLSMGMSEDYIQAISLGATDVRIGTALFGPRT
jgi:pyridoxal phosphate enzyme (YggS family)